MATVVNDRDVLIMGTTPRYTPPTDRGMFLTPSTAVFKLSADGQIASPSSFQFVATLLNMTGNVTWSTTGGISLITNGNVATLNFASFTAVSGTITASITVEGQTFTQIATVTKLADGVVTYTWVKYADSAAGAGLSDDPTGKAYIGLAYNKTTATESTTASDYTWSLIKGADGAKGADGVAGAKGADGATLYTWIKYADVADGTGLYDTPTASTMYIGLAVNKATATKSTVKTDYVWSRFKGDQGVAGSTGPQGIRGNVDISAVTSGSIWSDTEAAAALAAAGYGAPQVRDMVNLYRADRTFSAQRMYSGSAWIAVDYVWNGNVFVKGSILPEAIDTRGLTIRDANGNVILNAGASLANQSAVNPNLVSRVSSWTNHTSRSWCYFDTSSPQPGNVPAPPNGEFIILPSIINGQLEMYTSDVLPIPAGAWYTVSFYAWNMGGSAGSIASDIYGMGSNGQIVDTNGVGPYLAANSAGFFTFTEQMPANGNKQQTLRIFSGDTSNQWAIWNVKVELGKKQTAWCDNVITRYNASTYMQSAAIDFAYIDKASIADLSVVSQKVGTLTNRVNGTGKGMVLTSNGFVFYDENSIDRISLQVN